MIMIILGIFQAIQGLAAIFNDEFYVITQNYAFDLDTTGWGWIHLILGILVAAAGFALLAGATWAGDRRRSFWPSLSAIANFFFIPYYPFWSLLLIAPRRLGDLGRDAAGSDGVGLTNRIAAPTVQSRHGRRHESSTRR